MDSSLNDIMEDLFALAPDLRERRAEVQAALEKMLAAKPPAELDAAFRTELRERLLKEFAVVGSQAADRSWHFAFTLSKPALAVGGVLGLVVVVALAMNGVGPRPKGNVAADSLGVTARADQAAPPVKLALGGEIKRVGAGAFGQLNGGKPSEGVTTQGAGGNSVSMAAAPSADRAEVGTPVPSISARPEMAPNPSAAVGAAKMIAPDSSMPFRYQPTRHEYRYDGELTLPKEPVEVLKIDQAVDTRVVTGRLAGLNLGLIDLGRFDQAQTQNLNLVEDREFGYSVNVDFQNGTAYISQNWTKWPVANNPTPLAMGDLPADNETIAVAAVFVRDYGIDIKHYGEPTVDKAWQRQVMPADGSPVYVPERVTVRYPLLVAGKPVYDQSGYPQGLNVSVDVRLKKVTDAGPIALQNYLASAYEPISDAAKVTQTVAAGGLNRWVDQNAEKVVSHDLDAPQEVLMQVWSYADGVSSQYLVPAWLFRTKDAGAPLKDGEWYQDSVIIPLAKDFYTETPGPIMYLKGGGVTTEAVPVPMPADAPLPPTKTLR